MKLLVIVPWYEPAWSTGGTATAVSSLNRELVKQGVDITVLTTNDAGGGKFLDVELDREYNYGGVKVFYYSCDFFIKSKKAFFSKGLIKKIIKEIPKYDLIHVHGTRHAYGLAVALLSKIYKKKYIVTPHASLMKWWINKIGNPILKKIYMRLIEKYIIINCEALHFLTLEEKFQSEKYIYNKCSFIVGNGINIKEFERNMEVRQQWREKYKVNNKIVLLFLGRIHPQKNLHLVIESLEGLSKFVLFIVGPIYDKIYYKRLLKIIKEKKIKKQIFFIPPVKRENVKFWFWFADLFVLPSVVEGISMSIIEAIASSLPVLVSKNVANFREIEEDNCGIVVETSSIDLRKKLQEILFNNIDLNVLSKNSEKAAKKRYDIRLIAKNMLENYYKVIKKYE